MQVQRDKKKSGETLRNEDLAQHCADLGAAGAEDGVGVVLSHAGVVPSGRPRVIIAIAESQEMLSHFVTTTEHTKPHSLHVFMDGKWDFGHISRNLQAFMATLVGPVTLKGYSFAITLMDVKSAEDYRTGVEPIINMLKKAFTAAGSTWQSTCRCTRMARRLCTRRSSSCAASQSCRLWSATFMCTRTFTSMGSGL